MKHPDQETLSCLMDGEWRELDVPRCVEDACRDEALRAKWSRYHLARDVMRREVSVGAAVSLAERVRARLADEPAHSNVTAIFEASDAGRANPSSGGTTESVAAASGVVSSGGTRSGEISPGTDALADTGPSRRSAAMAASPGGTPKWRGVLGGAALAASVALATVFGLDAWRGGAPDGEGAGGAVGSAFDVAALPASPPADAAAARDGFSRQIAGVPLPEVELVANTGTGAYWTVAGAEPRRADSEARLNLFLSQHIEHSPAAEHQGMLPYSRLVGYDERAPER